MGTRPAEFTWSFPGGAWLPETPAVWPLPCVRLSVRAAEGGLQSSWSPAARRECRDRRLLVQQLRRTAEVAGGSPLVMIAEH